jgi:hypothetical protein
MAIILEARSIRMNWGHSSMQHEEYPKRKVMLKTLYLLVLSAALIFAAPAALPSAPGHPIKSGNQPPSTALINGKWFNGHSFENRILYSELFTTNSRRASRAASAKIVAASSSPSATGYVK